MHSIIYTTHTYTHNRTEVFDKYYFPAQWETTEMESIINFFKLEDPFSGSITGGGGHRSSCTSNNSGKGGGNDKKKSSSGANRSSRRRGSANIRRATTSGTTGGSMASICDSNTSGSSSLAASITSSFKLGLGDSADKLSKLLVSVYDLSWCMDCLCFCLCKLYAHSFIHTPYIISHSYSPG